MNKHFLYTFMISIFLNTIAQAQSDNKELKLKVTNLGLSVQVYPAGIIPTVNLEQYLTKRSSLVYRLGANIVDRQDFSAENDEEKGGGFGASIGYRIHYPLQNGEIIAGINMDVWNLWIDWRDKLPFQNMTSGTTYTLVLQPWLETGYFFHLKNSNSKIGITTGFGREINTIVDGKQVAQDWIASVTVQYVLSLNK
ncbi:hypothetical protein [Arenibacter sp. S6351L]|uniref:hypothetical protein n=1 Tax=Arenibacter sp. S6351L TaxID=2926407 RepID=UPI001FF54631|nr:hypothetical protein [Arenibacter sp. S6351L]MCK0135931.1 hypothetical protein [Arenibacter sp. S6351L]